MQYLQIKKLLQSEKNFLEKYLTNIKNPDLRKTLTKLCLHNHQLEIEVCRHKSIPKDSRSCWFCANNEIGDEKHLFLCCSNITISNLRKKLYSDISLISPNFLQFDNDDKFLYIFSGICRGLNNPNQIVDRDSLVFISDHSFLTLSISTFD